MANDISYSGTRQGTFMPNLVLVSPSEIFYQLESSFWWITKNISDKKKMREHFIYLNPLN
jgi:hypothetical protein